MIYDYRSPWGVEFAQTFLAPGKAFAERFERELAEAADVITTVNEPLEKKVKEYAPQKIVYIVPNYPQRSFCQKVDEFDMGEYAVQPGKGR